MPDRRAFLRTAAAVALAPGLAACARDRDDDAPAWSPAAFRRPPRSRVAILRAGSYDADLVAVVRDGIRAFDLPVRGRRVLLKPNLVEFDPSGVINTHPALIAATIEAFRSLDAREVVVGEGPGHRRDNAYLLRASGLADVLRDTGTRYVDLNTDAVRAVPALASYTTLGRLWLPRTLLDAELLVSMPKLKTHHWAGVTLSMKNMFGALPGAIYGWPKNTLHWAGIQESILDINATLTMPRFNIVDGIVGMEGNGPIQGSARPSGIVLFGEDPVAVDATAARLMTLEPERVPYIARAGQFIGNIADEQIDHAGEDLEASRLDYEVLDTFQFLRPAPLITGG